MKGDTIMKKIQILAILVIVALVFTGLKGGIEVRLMAGIKQETVGSLTSLL